MAKCTFAIPLTKAPEVVIEAAKKKIADAGGKMEGDAVKGSFAVGIPVLGKIAGVYTVTDQQLNVDVSDKPMMLSCDKIQGWLSKQLG